MTRINNIVKMSNMQETLSILVNGPYIKENEFDNVLCSLGNNETCYNFDIHDYVYLSRDGNEDKVVSDADDLTDNYLDVLVRHAYGYSNDTDGNELSQSLVEEYRKMLLTTLQN